MTEASVFQNKITGMIDYRYPSGRLLAITTVEKNGYHAEFYDNDINSKRLEGMYRDGKRDGTWAYYREDESVYRIEWYDSNGCIIEYKDYLPNDVLFRHGTPEGDREKEALYKQECEAYEAYLEKESASYRVNLDIE